MAYGASASTVLTLLGFCVCVIFIVFVCTRFACAIAKRRRRRQRRASPLPQYTVSPYVFPLQLLVGRHAGGASGAGLDPAAVAAFPTRAFACGPRDSSASPSSADAQCVICLEEYKDKDMMRYLPYCSHNFHIACIDVWLEQNSTCPICRISLRGNPDYTHRTPPPLSVAISPPCSPQESGSDPCRCLFVSTGHSSRASEVFSHEPDQENQLASGPSVDGATNNLPLPEAISPHEDNNQTVRKQVCRSSQLEPGK